MMITTSAKARTTVCNGSTKASSSSSSTSCFDDRFSSQYIQQNYNNLNGNNKKGISVDSIPKTYSSFSDKENHDASNIIDSNRWGGNDALPKGNVNNITSKPLEGIHGARMEGQHTNHITNRSKEGHKKQGFKTTEESEGGALAGASNISSTPNWMKDFFDGCQRDSVQLAQDLVENCKNDEIRKTWLELTAHRILQELLLVKATATATTKYNNQKKNTKSISERKVQNDANFSSPYLPKFNAEVGESAFVIFDQLMDADAMAITKNERDKLIGIETGNRMVSTIKKIHNSGVMFSPKWKSEYKLQDNLLILCLDRRKLARAEQESLRRIIQEFDLWSLLPLILDDWGLHTEEWFQDLFCRVKEDGWQSRTKTDMHCLIFVCRTYRCMQSLQWTNIRNGLARKVRRCLEILQENSQKKADEAANLPCLNPRQNSTGMWYANSRESPSHDDILRTSLQSTSINSEDYTDTRKGGDGNENKLVATLLSANSKDGGSQNISVSIRIGDETFVKNNDRDKEETVEQKCASLGLKELMMLPTEKLCPVRGKILESFESAEKARLASSNSINNQNAFKCAILGTANVGPHLYNGYFWRLKGSHMTPSLVSKKFASRGRKRRNCTSTAAISLPTDATIEEKSLRYSASQVEEMPVEKLCLRTGNVLETFDTLALARRAVSNTSSLSSLFRFRDMLQGWNNRNMPNVYKGYFWRFKGSHRTPFDSPKPFPSSSTGASTRPGGEGESLVVTDNGGGETLVHESPKDDVEGPSKKQKLGHNVVAGENRNRCNPNL